MSRRKMDNTCAGCSWQTKIWQYLGWKPYCKRYRAIRDQKCIDFTPNIMNPETYSGKVTDNGQPDGNPVLLTPEQWAAKNRELKGQR